MKKVHVKNKLSLNKETIVRLNHDEMHRVKGGEGESGSFCICPTDNCEPSGSAIKCCIPASRANCPSHAC